MDETKPWEVTIKDGVLNCRINLDGPDAVTVALGVCDRIKSLVMSMEAKIQMQKELQKMKSGVIVPGLVHPQNGNA